MTHSAFLCRRRLKIFWSRFTHCIHLFRMEMREIYLMVFAAIAEQTFISLRNQIEVCFRLNFPFKDFVSLKVKFNVRGFVLIIELSSRFMFKHRYSKGLFHSWSVSKCCSTNSDIRLANVHTSLLAYFHDESSSSVMRKTRTLFNFFCTIICSNSAEELLTLSTKRHAKDKELWNCHLLCFSI